MLQLDCCGSVLLVELKQLNYEVVSSRTRYGDERIRIIVVNSTVVFVRFFFLQENGNGSRDNLSWVLQAVNYEEERNKG